MARRTRIRRKDLKRPDEFLSATRRALVWLHTHRRLGAWAGSALLVALIAVAAYVSMANVRRRDANADLARALDTFREQTLADAGLQLGEVARRWKNTGAGQIARLLEASTEARRQNFEAAVTSLDEALKNRAAWPPYLVQQALVTQGFALEAKGQLKEGLSSYSEAAALAGPYIGQALVGQARCYEGTGDGGRAQEVRAKVRADFPELGEGGAGVGDERVARKFP